MWSSCRQRLAVGLLLIGLVPSSTAAQEPLDADEVTIFVRRIYIEGFPYLAPGELTPEAVERLSELLHSPEDAPYRSNIVLALGMSGQPRAAEALSEFAADAPSGEASSSEYRARTALRLAFGHLARRDDDALNRLILEARGRAGAPAWSYGALWGAELEALLRRTAMTGLAVSGRPEAEAALDALAADVAADPSASRELRRHVQESRALCGRVRRDGPDRTFGERRRATPER